MHFQVPQFIEVEDKIFGPLTLKQFLYLVGGGATIFLLFIIFPFFIFIILATLVGALSISLAFYKIHGKPFIKTLENSFNYLRNSKIYIWKKTEKPEKKPTTKKEVRTSETEQQTKSPPLAKEKLTDLAWSLDVKKETKQNE